MAIEKFKLYDTTENTLKQWARALNFLFDNNLDNSNISSISSTAITLSANQVKASNIDFGTGADQVDAADIVITDASSYYATATVEGALQEIGSTVASHTLTLASYSTSISYLYNASSSSMGRLTILESTILNLPAENVKIVDASSYYTSTSVEGALQVLGAFKSYTTNISAPLSTTLVGIADADLNHTNGLVNEIRTALVNFGILIST